MTNRHLHPNKLDKTQSQGSKQGIFLPQSNHNSLSISLYLSSNSKDKVCSIPFVPRPSNASEAVGPGSYDPQLSSIMKKHPVPIISGGNGVGNKAGAPKKALEKYIKNIFNEGEEDDAGG